MALACDMRVISKDAKVGLTFATLGLHPGMGSTFFLPRLVGHERACRMILTGEIMNGAEACENGMGESVPVRYVRCMLSLYIQFTSPPLLFPTKKRPIEFYLMRWRWPIESRRLAP